MKFNIKYLLCATFLVVTSALTSITAMDRREQIKKEQELHRQKVRNRIEEQKKDHQQSVAPIATPQTSARSMQDQLRERNERLQASHRETTEQKNEELEKKNTELEAFKQALNQLKTGISGLDLESIALKDISNRPSAFIENIEQCLTSIQSDGKTLEEAFTKEDLEGDVLNLQETITSLCKRIKNLIFADLSKPEMKIQINRLEDLLNKLRSICQREKFQFAIDMNTDRDEEIAQQIQDQWNQGELDQEISQHLPSSTPTQTTSASKEEKGKEKIEEENDHQENSHEGSEQSTENKEQASEEKTGAEKIEEKSRYIIKIASLDDSNELDWFNAPWITIKDFVWQRFSKQPNNDSDFLCVQINNSLHKFNIDKENLSNTAKTTVEEGSYSSTQNARLVHGNDHDTIYIKIDIQQEFLDMWNEELDQKISQHLPSSTTTQTTPASKEAKGKQKIEEEKARYIIKIASLDDSNELAWLDAPWITISEKCAEYCDYLYVIINNIDKENLSNPTDITFQEGSSSSSQHHSKNARFIREKDQDIIYIKIDIQKEILEMMVKYIIKLDKYYNKFEKLLLLATHELASFIKKDLENLENFEGPLIQALINAADILGCNPIFNALAIFATKNPLADFPSSEEISAILNLLEKGHTKDEVLIKRIKNLATKIKENKTDFTQEQFERFTRAMIRNYQALDNLPSHIMSLNSVERLLSTAKKASLLFNSLSVFIDGGLKTSLLDGSIAIPPTDNYRSLLSKSENDINKQGIFITANYLCRNHPHLFERMLKKSNFEHRRSLLTEMVSFLKKEFSFKEDVVKMKEFFEKLPEGFIKMAMRFIYKGKYCKDNFNIDYIRDRWSRIKNNIDLGKAFSDTGGGCWGGRRLIPYMMTLIQLAKPLYPDIDDTKLNLSDNELTTLPEELIELPHLKTLRLRNNMFNQFPTVVCNIRSLESLYLSGDWLPNIPDEIENLTNLRELEIQIDRLSPNAVDSKISQKLPLLIKKGEYLYKRQQ